MKKIYINAAHSSCSPGGVWGARTEHADVLKFGGILRMRLERENISTELFTGELKRKSFSEDDIVIVLHRASNMKNSESFGASVTVIRDASCEVQYEAFRLLESICSDSFFRMKRVHTSTASDCRFSINNKGTDRIFLFDLGYIDSSSDNRIFDRHYEIMAERLAEKIKEIYKEEKNENNSTV